MICGKTIYTSREAAITAIQSFNSDKRPTTANRMPQKTYWCDPCEGWHVYSKQKKHIRKSKSKDINTQAQYMDRPKYNGDSLVIRNFSSKPIK